MRIRNAGPKDSAALLQMRTELWPDPDGKHSSTLEAFFDGKPSYIDQIIVCENDVAQLVGFAELRVRNYAEGSENMAVPYLEGWFVDSAYRGRGVGALLVAGAEEWARALGYRELASDAEIDNHASIAAHLALGFHEVDRSVCFLKKL